MTSSQKIPFCLKKLTKNDFSVRQKTVSDYVIILQVHLHSQFHGLSTLKEMQEQQATHLSDQVGCGVKRSS